MGLSEKLTEIKSEIEALTTYANGVTGESDTSIGDAIRTLVAGFGGGLPEGITEIATGIVTFDKEKTLWLGKSIPHGMTGKPVFAVMFDVDLITNPVNTYSKSILLCTAGVTLESLASGISVALNTEQALYNSQYVTLSNVGKYSGVKCTDTDIVVSSYNNQYVEPNRTYRWIAIA